MAEPTQNVFDVLEVSENILLQLPMKDILYFKGVCKTWETLIKTLPQLRKALFLSSDVAKDAATNAKKATINLTTKAGKLENLEVAFNPLLARKSEVIRTTCWLDLKHKYTATGRGFVGLEMHLTQISLKLEGFLAYEQNLSYMGLTTLRSTACEVHFGCRFKHVHSKAAPFFDNPKKKWKSVR